MSQAIGRGEADQTPEAEMIWAHLCADIEDHSPIFRPHHRLAGLVVRYREIVRLRYASLGVAYVCARAPKRRQKLTFPRETPNDRVGSDSG